MNLKRVRSLVLSVLPLYLPLFAACSTPESVAPESADPGEERVGVAAAALATACTSTIAGANLGSLALKSDGTVLAAGDNSRGQLGDGTTTSRSTPMPVSGLSGVTALSGGWSSYALALRSDQTVWGWGANTWGQLGDGTGTDRSTPVPVSGLTGVKAVSAVYLHGLAVKSDGTVWAWGINSAGQLGDGTTIYSSNTPVQVIMPSYPAGPPAPDGSAGPPPGTMPATAVAGGNGHSLALMADGTIQAWGGNGQGQLGDGTTIDRNPGVPVSGLSSVTAIAAGTGSSLALRSDGTVWAWGYNNEGQLGDGTTTTRTTPVQVSGLSGVIAVAEGYNASFAVKSDGTVWAWGANGQGQLGDGTTVNRDMPVRVLLPAGSVAGAVSAGQHHALAQTSDGAVWAWGDNSKGQLGDGTTTDRHTPVLSAFAGGAACVAACPCLDPHLSSFLAQMYGQILSSPSACTPAPAETISGNDMLSQLFGQPGPDTALAQVDGTGALSCTTSKLQGMGTSFGPFGPTSLSITAQQQQGCFAAMSQSVAAHGLSCHDPACVPVTCAQMGTTCGAIPNGCGGVLQCDECPAGQACGGSGAPSNVCGAFCAPPQTLCATGCTDLPNDPFNCGACGVVCPMGSACKMGECSPFDGP